MPAARTANQRLTIATNGIPHTIVEWGPKRAMKVSFGPAADDVTAADRALCTAALCERAKGHRYDSMFFPRLAENMTTLWPEFTTCTIEYTPA